MKLPLDTRYTFTLGGLILVGGGIAYLGSGLPAVAAVPNDAVVAHLAVTAFLHNGASEIQQMQTTLAATEKSVRQLNDSAAGSQIPLGDLKGNPFRSNSASATTAADAHRDDERLALVKCVDTLQLQSILQSDTGPACMINNTLYRQGQPLDKFTVDQISDTAVVIRSGEYRFELRIQR